MNTKKSNALSILSLIFGILGLVLSCLIIGFLPALVGLILGIVALAQKQSKGMAITGIVCGAIGVLFAMILFAAIPTTDTTQNSSQSENTENSSIVEELPKEETEKRIPAIEESVIYNSNDVVITVKGIEQSGKDYNVKLLIENNSALNLGFHAHAYGVNGVMSGNNIYDMACDVAAGKKANTSLEIESSFMDENGIDEIRYIDLLLWAYDNDKSYKEFDTDQLRIETSLFDNRSDALSGTTIHDENGMYVDFIGRENDTFTFMLTNNTGSYLNVDFAEISINDYTMTDYNYDLCDKVILCNNVALFSITIDEDFKEENSIDEIRKIEWNLNCRPNGSYFDEYKLGPILYEVQ